MSALYTRHFFHGGEQRLANASSAVAAELRGRAAKRKAAMNYSEVFPS